MGQQQLRPATKANKAAAMAAAAVAAPAAATRQRRQQWTGSCSFGSALSAKCSKQGRRSFAAHADKAQQQQMRTTAAAARSCKTRKHIVICNTVKK